MIRFRFVEEHRTTHRVKRICDVLGWNRSGYYAWRKNKETRQEKAGRRTWSAGSGRSTPLPAGPTEPAGSPANSATGTTS
ncbi:hypothetical protein [Streptomyces sp. NPDC088801]|uniref:hypothetical protein n=1 Tax=Streptomyces sp. NPDC088801 TaxID=3365903 RepID=UPI0038297059